MTLCIEKFSRNCKPISGSGKRIYRGGGQNDSAGYCTSALRGRFLPDRKSGSLGFRLAMTLSPSS